MNKQLSTGPIIYVMGVSGSGKSTIGQMLASALQLPYREADDFHPAENIAKMASGQPLNDADRRPWLQALNAQAIALQAQSGAVISCSALKNEYRILLQQGLVTTSVKWIYLHGTKETISARMSSRQDHFMPSTLLQSQLDTLEEPVDAIRVEIDQSPREIVNTILNELE
ncbi:MAG: gluconokinase [Bacteroidota bacterium]